MIRLLAYDGETVVMVRPDAVDALREQGDGDVTKVYLRGGETFAVQGSIREVSALIEKKD